MSDDKVSLQSDRLGVGNRGFVLCSGSSLDLREEARRIYTAVSEAVSAGGGWLIEDGIPGGRADGFAELMRKRADGALPWEVVCPVTSVDKPRKRLEMKLPLTATIYLGSPCWALQRHLYALDLFNPSNELLLPYSDDRRFWQITPWPVRFWSDPVRAQNFAFEPFCRLIVAAAEAIECSYGFGGRGLKNALWTAVSVEEWSRSLGAEGRRLTDYAYPFMLVPRSALTEEAVESLLKDDFSFLGGQKVCRPCFVEVVGSRDQYVMLGLAMSPESYPVGDYDLGHFVGKLLGKPYIVDALEKLAPS